MPAKPGPKSKFNRADHERIRRMLADGYTDEQVASIFGVHRTTVGRLRHHLDGAELPAEELSALEALIDLAGKDYGGDAEKRAAELKDWRRKYGGADAVKAHDRRVKAFEAWKNANRSNCAISRDGNGYCEKCTNCFNRGRELTQEQG
jgi:hypothetical protein